MATTSKEINLAQLDQELGNQGLCANFENPKEKIIIVADNSTVTEEQLKAAISAHVAKPTEQEIKMLNREQGIAKLKELGFTKDQIIALINS